MSNAALFFMCCTWLLVEVNPSESTPAKAARIDRFAAQFVEEAQCPPLSFDVDGQAFEQQFERWSYEHDVEPGAGRTKHILRWKDPETGLSLRCHLFEYPEFSTIEWVGVLQNEGDAASPLIENVRMLDADFPVKRELTSSAVVLRYLAGGKDEAAGLQLRQRGLSAGQRVALPATAGSPSGEAGDSSALPYFNLQLNQEEGLVFGLGWPGQWTADFARADSDQLRITSGQGTSRFRLEPGEVFRLPRVAMQFYEGDWIDAQNGWRRWMRYHNSPRVQGRLPQPRIAAANPPSESKMDAASQLAGLDRYVAADLPLDLWCIDAGWYPFVGRPSATGTWRVDETRFPDGLRAVTNHARRHRLRAMVWFAPERVAADTELDRDHPDWLLNRPKATEVTDDDWRLLNLARAEVQAWLLDRIDQLIESEGIDVFRHDLPDSPAAFWQAQDEPDRVGVAENQYVQGCLQVWNELRRRHPRLVIDAGGEGGSRADLETLRRSFSPVRGQPRLDPTHQQTQSYGLALWFPYFGSRLGSGEVLDVYTFRSFLAPHQVIDFDLQDEAQDQELLQRLVAEWREVAPLFLQDYYPLTPSSASPHDWLAWQYHLPQRRVGIVQAFRRRACDQKTLTIKLRGLAPEEHYVWWSADQPDQRQRQSGQELMETGITFEAERPETAVLILYHQSQ